MVKKPSVGQLLAASLDALMGKGKNRKPQSFLAAKGVAQSAIREILLLERDPGISTLEIIAAEFDLRPWQLLVEEFDPKQPPMLKKPSASEAAFYARIRALAKEMGIDDSPDE